VTPRTLAIQCNKHYLSADFETNKAFYDDATKSQSAAGANVFGAKRWRVARYRARVVRAVGMIKGMLRGDLLREC